MAGSFAVACLPSVALAVEGVLIRATTIADLSIQPAVGGIFTVKRRPYIISEALWTGPLRTAITQMVKFFEFSGRGVAVIAVDDADRPGYAAVDGEIMGEAPHSGVVLLGQAMSDRLAKQEGKEHFAPLAGALAHELAHLYQFRLGPAGDAQTWWQLLLEADGNRTRRRAELHADFLAGWCLGRGGYTDEAGIDHAANRMYAQGDTEGNDPNHHGTPHQRYAALLRGFFVGRNNQVDVAAAARAGRLFVNAIVPMSPEP